MGCGYTCNINKENIFSDLLYNSNFPCINDNKNLFLRGAYLVKNTYKNITKEEKIQLYLRILESIKFKEDITSEKNSNLRKTKPR